MFGKVSLATLPVMMILCLTLLACGSDDEEPIYQADPGGDLHGAGGLYDVGGKVDAPDTDDEKPYVSPFGPKPIEDIKWASSIQAAKASARPGTGKKILVWFVSSDCVECREIERDVFPAEVVLKQAHKYVWVRFDTDANPEKTEYYIQDLEPPVMLWMDSEGNSYHRLVGGFNDPDKLALRLLEWH